MQITVRTASINYAVSYEYCSFNWVLLVFDGWRSEKAVWNKLQQSILWNFHGCSLPLNLHSNWIPIRFYAPWVIRRRCTRSNQWASFMLLFGVFLPSFLPPSYRSPPSSRWVFGVWKVLYVVYQPRAARQPAVANQLKSKWVINNKGFFHPLIWLVVQSRGIRCAATPCRLRFSSGWMAVDNISRVQQGNFYHPRKQFGVVIRPQSFPNWLCVCSN